MGRYCRQVAHGRWLGIAVAAALAVCAARVGAQPAGGFSLVSGDPLTAFRVSTPRATSGVVDVDGPGFDRAFHIDVTHPGETWDVELGARLGRAEGVQALTERLGREALALLSGKA